jgi:hypothetical protein
MENTVAKSAQSDRMYGLSTKDVALLKNEYATSNTMPNPYKNGAYKFTVAGLLVLGANEFHPLARVRAAFAKASGKDWFDAWASKELRSKQGKDADGRFVQNLRVLQRTADYAKRLLETGKKVLKSKGAVIDLQRDQTGELLVRLNLDSAVPMKPNRTRKSDLIETTQPKTKFNRKKGKAVITKAASKSRTGK